MTKWHPCLACEDIQIPQYRALCKRCFPHIPWELRADILHTYRDRIEHRARYEEKLIALRQWVLQEWGEWV